MESSEAANLLNQMTKVQHRDYQPMVDSFIGSLKQEPDLAVRSLLHIVSGSEIRDQVDAAIMALLCAPDSLEWLIDIAGKQVYTSARDIGEALLGNGFIKARNMKGYEQLEPFRVLRILLHLPERDDFSWRRVGRLAREWAKWIERNPSRIDGILKRSRKDMERLYTFFHLHPGPYVQEVLFNNTPVEDSVNWWVQRIKSAAPEEKALLGAESGLSFQQLSSLLPPNQVSSSLALIESMTPNEAVNSIRWLEKSGLADIPEVNKLFQDKVKQADVSATALHRKSAQGQREDLKQAREVAALKTMQSRKQIDWNVVVAVDISFSMKPGIEVARHFFTNMAPIMPNLLACAFNQAVYELVLPKDLSIESVTRATARLAPGGQTHIGLVVPFFEQRSFSPDGVVLVTDGGENTPGGGDYVSLLRAYCNRVGKEIYTYIIGIESTDYTNGMPAFLRRLSAANLPHQEFKWSGDYNIFDQIGFLMGGDRPVGLYEKVMDIQLPVLERRLR